MGDLESTGKGQQDAWAVVYERTTWICPACRAASPAQGAL